MESNYLTTNLNKKKILILSIPTLLDNIKSNYFL